MASGSVRERHRFLTSRAAHNSRYAAVSRKRDGRFYFRMAGAAARFAYIKAVNYPNNSKKVEEKTMARTIKDMVKMREERGGRVLTLRLMPMLGAARDGEIVILRDCENAGSFIVRMNMRLRAAFVGGGALLRVDKMGQTLLDIEAERLKGKVMHRGTSGVKFPGDHGRWNEYFDGRVSVEYKELSEYDARAIAADLKANFCEGELLRKQRLADIRRGELPNFVSDADLYPLVRGRDFDWSSKHPVGGILDDSRYRGKATRASVDDGPHKGAVIETNHSESLGLTRVYVYAPKMTSDKAAALLMYIFSDQAKGLVIHDGYSGGMAVQKRGAAQVLGGSDLGAHMYVWGLTRDEARVGANSLLAALGGVGYDKFARRRAKLSRDANVNDARARQTLLADNKAMEEARKAEARLPIHPDYIRVAA